jgi:hypothetical protein
MGLQQFFSPLPLLSFSLLQSFFSLFRRWAFFRQLIPRCFSMLWLHWNLLLLGFNVNTDVGCGCFGEIIPDSTREMAIVRNVCLSFLSVFVAKSVGPLI